jgi:hypothetical protein
MLSGFRTKRSETTSKGQQLMDNTQITLLFLSVAAVLQGIAIHARERRARLKSEKRIREVREQLSECRRQMFQVHNDAQRFEDAVRDTHVVEYRTGADGRSYIYSITRKLVERMKPFNPESWHLDLDEEDVSNMERALKEIDALPVHECGVCGGEFPGEELMIVHQASGPMRACEECRRKNGKMNPCEVCGFETPERDIGVMYRVGLAIRACSDCILSEQRTEEDGKIDESDQT